MPKETLLAQLADLAGIESRFRDETGKIQTTPEIAKRGVLRAMGFAVDSQDEIADGVRRMHLDSWTQVVPPVLVVQDGLALAVPLTLPTAEFTAGIDWDFVDEFGVRKGGHVPGADLQPLAAESIDDVRYERRRLLLPVTPPPGHHFLRIAVAEHSHELPIMVSGGRCHLPRHIARGSGAWGFAAQLYALRSARNWGIGDFTDLRELIRISAEQGADAVGINPLHALSLAHPERASPYSPSTRLLFNVIYLDVEACPELQISQAARDLLNSNDFSRWLARLRGCSMVDYPGVVAAKLSILENLYASFRSTHLAADGHAALTERGRDFQNFRIASGPDLWRWAVFEALAERFTGCSTWREWPTPYRDAASAEVAAFAETHRDRVTFFEYVQWQTERQLAETAEECRTQGMGIGLYHDLALGVDHDSADVWGSEHLYAADASIGSPPDVMNRHGQNWGIAPMNWLVLRKHAYQPFVSVLRAGMRFGGALRIDHAMSLQRLFWIPEGAEPAEGAYVRQPFEDLVGVLAAESQRQKCLVIGEDLGTVPAGFRKRMERAGVLSYRPLLFQIDRQRRFRPPSAYPRLSAAVVGTHDMATLPGYWVGRDIDVRREIGHLPTREAADQEGAQRADEKMQLIEALAREGVLPDLPTEDYAELTDDLARAVHAFLARTPSRLVMVRLEDVLGGTEQHNVPGTVVEYANWRCRMSHDLTAIAADPRIHRLAELLRHYRPAASKHPAGGKVKS